ncbi:MAG: MFS transporter [Pseudomonadota bacterium]
MPPRIFILSLATFAAATQTYAFVGVLEDVAADLGVSVAAAGQLSSAFAIIFALSAPVSASFAAGLERRSLLVGALTIVAALNLVTAWAPNFEALIGLRVATALASTLVAPVALSAAAVLAPPEARGRALAMVLAGLVFAFTLGIPGGTAIGGAFGWRACFLFAGGLAAVAAGAIAAVLPRVESRERPGLGNLAAALQPRTATLLAVTVGSFLGLFTVVAYVGPMVTRVTGFEGAAIGAVQMFVGLGAILGIVLGGRAADASSPRKALLNCLSVSALSLLAYSGLMQSEETLTEIGRVMLLMATTTFGAASLFALGPIVQSQLIASAPSNQNVVLALNGSMTFLGQGLGAAAGGLVIAQAGLEWIGVAGGALSVLTALIAARLKRVPEPSPVSA